jgi:hypothetical protein
LLGSEPTSCRTKGEVWTGPKTGKELISHTGSWHLKATSREPEDLDGQVAELLGKLTKNLDVWASLSRKFRIDLYCGLFMKSSNEGAMISPATLAALGDRHIALGLDIYDGSR